MTTKTHLYRLIDTSSQVGQVGLIILPDQTSTQQELLDICISNGLVECVQPNEILHALNNKQACFYKEKEIKLNALIVDIVREYEGGMLSMMDRIDHTGLQVARFTPNETSFVVLVTKAQLEASDPMLLQYMGPILELPTRT